MRHKVNYRTSYYRPPVLFVLVVSSQNTPRAFRKNPAKLLVTSAKGKGPLLLTQSGTVVQLTRNSE